MISAPLLPLPLMPMAQPCKQGSTRSQVPPCPSVSLVSGVQKFSFKRTPVITPEGGISKTFFHHTAPCIKAAWISAYRVRVYSHSGIFFLTCIVILE